MNYLDLPSELQEHIGKHLPFVDLYHLMKAGVAAARNILHTYFRHTEIIANLITLSFCDHEVMKADPRVSPVVCCVDDGFLHFWCIGRSCPVGDIYLKVVMRSKEEILTNSIWTEVEARWAYLKIPPGTGIAHVYRPDTGRKENPDYSDLTLRTGDTYLILRNNLRSFLQNFSTLDFERTGELLTHCQVGNIARLYEAYFDLIPNNPRLD